MQEKLHWKVRALSLPLNLIAIAGLGYFSYLSLRLAYADLLARAKTLSAVQRATSLDPGNAQTYVLLAEMQESEGGNPDPALRKATALNPRDSYAWTRLGFRAEAAGDYAAAERLLLEAAHVDKQLDPRWALMNYYFRRADPPNFWIWTRKSLEMSYGDLTSIFRLCWRMTKDPAEIRRALPSAPSVRAGFIGFLLAEDQASAAADLAADFVGEAHTSDLPLLVSCCEKALQKNLVPQALRLWNLMCHRKLIAGSPLDPERGSVLTNGAFASIPLGTAFDWHISADPEISTVQTGNGVRLTLSGRQPEACDLLWQYIPVSPGRRYRFRFQVQLSGAAPQSGIRWQVAAVPGGKPLLLESNWLADGEGKPQEFTFTAGGAALCRLALTYQRALGTTRMEGTVMLQNLKLEVVP